MKKTITKIYCIHSWISHECGGTADSWRECERCGTDWPSLSSETTGNGLTWPTKQGIYGKEPKTAIAYKE